MKLAAIIPASGKGLRYGMPKADALLESGESFEERIKRLCAEAGMEDICVVREPSCAQMLDSICLGIKSLPEMDAYLIFPVDHPYVTAQTIAELIRAWHQNPKAVIKPCHQGKCGHPIIIPKCLALHPELPGGLAACINRSRIAVLKIQVDDPGILKNLNYPSDL